MTDARPRLLMIAHAFFPTEVRIAAEVRAAVAAGYAVDVIALRDDGQRELETVIGARAFRLPVTHRHGAGIGAMVREYLGFLIGATGKATALGRQHRYAIVQIHNPPDFLVWAALVPRLRGAKVVFDVHDLSPDMFDMRFAGRRYARFADRVLRALERSACALADEVLTVHEPYRVELGRRGVPLSKITVLMNSPDDRVMPGASTDRSQSGGFRVAYHGTLTPHYGVDILARGAAEAAQSIPGLSLEIYGDGDMAPELERIAADLGFSDRLKLSRGFRPQREVLEIVRSADVGVVPNRPTRLNRYALSTKLLEYVALEVPVVCADLPTIRAHFDDSEVLYFKAGDPHALAAALRQVQSDPDGAAHRAKQARRRFVDYRWSTMERRYVTVLDGLVSGRRRLDAGVSSSP